MRIFVAALLVSSIAFADPPDSHFATPSDAPLDQAGSSVHLLVGEGAPFDGQLLSDAENLRRGKKRAELEAFKTSVETGVLLDKAVFYSLIAVAAVAIASSVTLGVIVAKQQK